MLCSNEELSHTAVSTRKGFNYGVWFSFIVNEKRGKQESLNHFRIITNVAHQKALQEWPHKIHKVNFLEKQCNLAMKNFSAQSNVEHEQPEQILIISLTFVVCLLLQMKTVEKHHGKSLTRVSANQTHTACCRGFEFKSGCEQIANSI